MPAGKGTYGDQVGRPPSPNKKSGFKMAGWGGWQNQGANIETSVPFMVNDEKGGEEKEKKKGANFMSYEDMINSNLYKKSAIGTEFTYWENSQNCPDCPIEKKVKT